MPCRFANDSALPRVGDATATTSISSGIALTEAAMQSAWRRERTIPIPTLGTRLIFLFLCVRVELDVAATGASKCAQRQLLVLAKFDISKKTTALRRPGRPAGPREPPSVSNVGNVSAFHGLLTLGAAWHGRRQASVDRGSHAHAGWPGGSGTQPTHFPGVMM